jgi:hypothetical protein
MFARPSVRIGSAIVLLLLAVPFVTFGLSSTPKKPAPRPTPVEIDPGDGGGGGGDGGGGGPTPRTRYLDLNIPSWDVQQSFRVVLTSGANGLEQLDMYDAATGALIRSVTRAQHDAWCSAGGVPSIGPAAASRARDLRRAVRSSVTAIENPTSEPVFVLRSGATRTPPASIPFLTSIPAGDSAVTMVGSVHN